MGEKQIKQEKVRKVFLEELPKDNRGRIDWLRTKGYIIHFICDNIEGDVEIIDVIRENKTTILYIKYLNNTIFKIATGHFINCKLNEMLGLINHNYTHKVGDIIKDSKRNILITKLIRIKEYKAYEYECLNDGYIGAITEGHILSNRGCPACNNNYIIKGINDITTTHPHLVKYFSNIEDAYTNSYGSDNKVLFVCSDCGFEKSIKIGEFVKNGFACPKCGDGISLGNKIIFNILEQLIGINNFETEYVPKWCKYLFRNKYRQGIYDTYFKLNNKKYIIEMDGGFHFTDNKMNGQTSKESKYIDSEKDRLANEHGIEVIRIDCNPSKFKHIKYNILQNEILNELFDLSNINWNIVFEYTFTNKMKEACDLWNNNCDVNEISNRFKLSTNAIRRYLNNGNELNLCCYDGLKIKADNNVKKVRCIEYNLIFNSITECVNKLSEMLNIKFNIGNVSQVCIGNRKTHNKLHFEFV